MARRVRITKAAGKPEPIWTWCTKSSQPRGGEIISYETRLEEDGLIRCNCPGWVFSRGSPEEKTCKHKGQYQHEAPEILRKWKAGEALPMLNGGVDPATASGTVGATNIKFGRLIEV